MGARRIAAISLRDSAAVGRVWGQDGPPYPLALTHPRNARIEPSSDRIDDGELLALQHWADAYICADIWVACRVFRTSADPPGPRILVHAAADTGYLACQVGNDVVEVSKLPAIDLSSAIAGSIGLTTPGTRSQIVIPGYVQDFADRTASKHDEDDDDTMRSVRDPVHRPEPAHSVVADDRVVAIATIQSRWQPPHRWGVDWTRNVIVCVRIDADGDYIYAPDFSHAAPVTEPILSERIQAQIDEDISALRHHRGVESRQ